MACSEKSMRFYNRDRICNVHCSNILKFRKDGPRIMKSIFSSYETLLDRFGTTAFIERTVIRVVYEWGHVLRTIEQNVEAYRLLYVGMGSGVIHLAEKEQNNYDVNRLVDDLEKLDIFKRHIEFAISLIQDVALDNGVLREFPKLWDSPDSRGFWKQGHENSAAYFQIILANLQEKPELSISVPNSGSYHRGGHQWPMSWKSE